MSSPRVSDADGLDASERGALARLRAAHGGRASASSSRVVRVCDAIESAIEGAGARVTSTSVFAAAFGALERAIEAAETGGEDALEALEAVARRRRRRRRMRMIEWCERRWSARAR